MQTIIPTNGYIHVNKIVDKPRGVIIPDYVNTPGELTTLIVIKPDPDITVQMDPGDELIPHPDGGLLNFTNELGETIHLIHLSSIIAIARKPITSLS